MRRFDAVVATTGIQVVLIGVETREELRAAFEEMKQKRIQGLIVQADELFIREGKRIVELAAAYRMPAIYRLGEQAAAGGLMAYGPSVSDMYRRTASSVDKILKGAKPGELPVEQPTKVELVINQKTARQLGLVIPSHLLVRADQVIE
jgi:putative ABC transport system substrate-binding protein